MKPSWCISTNRKYIPIEWKRYLLMLSLVSLTVGPAFSQNVGPSHPRQFETWSDLQEIQAWATRKLGTSPRRHEWVTVSAAGHAVRAFVTYPEGVGKKPVVLVLHEVFGLTDSTRNTADEIAGMGYITIAPDMLSGYGPGGGGTQAFPLTRAAGNAITALPNDTVNATLKALAEYGLKLPAAEAKLAIVGLSWGGGAAFRYAIAPSHLPQLKAVFVFYDVGPPAVTQGPERDAKDNPPISVAPLTVPVYGFYGSTDRRVMASLQATKDAMAAAGKSYDPVVYKGADHAFMRVGEDPANSNPANVAAVTASFARLEKLLARM